MSRYEELGFKSRSKYLFSLVDKYKVEQETVFALALTMGKSEDFGNLITEIEAYSVYEY